MRFGLWKEALDAPAPSEKFPVLKALWHHARGMAYASTNRPREAKAELAAIQSIEKSIPEDLKAGTPHLLSEPP